MKLNSTFTWRKSALLLVAVALLPCFVNVSSAQNKGSVKRYVASTFSGTYVGISSGTFIMGAQDDYNTTFSIPFSFNYDSVQYTAGSTNLNIASNGFMQIASNNGNGCCSNYIASYPNMIGIFSQDMYVNTGVYYTVTGTSPTQVLTIEWQNIRGYSSTGNTCNIEVKLYQATGVVEIWYSNLSTALTYAAAGVGLTGSVAATDNNLYGNVTSTPSTQLRWTPPAPPTFSELAISPKAIAFGSLLTGQSSTQCVTITNVGPSATLTFNNVSISGNPDFTFSGPLPGPLAPGASTSLCVTFAPLASGGRSANINISTNGQDSGSQSVQLSGTGIAPSLTNPTTQLFKRTKTKLGTSLTQSFLVTSSGTGALTFNSFVISGIYAGDYTVTRFPANPLPSGVSDTVSVTYSPTLEGSRPATLVITSNALNLPRDTVQLYGIGILPRLVVTPNPLNFDSVGVGQTVCLPITLYNPGTDTVQITRNYFSSADADFTLTPLSGTDTSIAPDKSKQVTVCFTPTRNGSRQARFRVTTSIPLTFDAVRRDTSFFNINILGTGVPYGRLAVGGSAIVDSTIIGQQICRTDTFYNTGSADLTLNSATITGANAGDYVLSGVTFPVVIPAGTFKVFTICATPSQRGDRNATLVLVGTSNSSAVNASLPIDVYGQLACASASPQNAFTAKTCVGLSDSAVITVSNCGDVRTTYTAALSTGASAYSIAGATTSPVTAAGGTATFTVRFTPTTGGTQNATLTVTGTGGVTQTVNLTGTASTSTIAGADSSKPTRLREVSQFTVKINNTGDCDWVPGIPTLSDPQFTYVSGGTTNIPAKGSGSLTLSFAPTKQYEQFATLSFPSSTGVSNPAPNVSVHAYGLPILGVARQTEANGFSLMQNYPNPFNPTTEIRFVLPKDATVRLDIIDVTGKVVRTVLNQHMAAGDHGTVVDASELSSGTYYYQLSAGSVVLTRQMVLAK